ncbi:MAG: PH domain-containing protein [Gemmatimonadaceae bacterium]|nr:PH domain-containing protein [Acetobacteraceae bacterium]
MKPSHDAARMPRGLPERLPDGERLLWQGAPEWQTLARHLFNVRILAVYFAVIVTACVVLDVMDGAPAAAIALSTAKLVGAALGAMGFLALYAWMISKATVYTITSRRVVLKIGLAVPLTINLPFQKIESAELKLRSNGFGDVSLLLNSTERLAYFVAWPHARPWRMKRAEPTLRCIPEAAKVGQILARALAASAGMAAPTAPEAKSAAIVAPGAGQVAA